MKMDEDLARIRMNEAIQYGLQSQDIRRNLGRNRKSVSKTTLLLLVLVLTLAIAMAACLVTADLPPFLVPLLTLVSGANQCAASRLLLI